MKTYFYMILILLAITIYPNISFADTKTMTTNEYISELKRYIAWAEKSKKQLEKEILEDDYYSSKEKDEKLKSIQETFETYTTYLKKIMELTSQELVLRGKFYKPILIGRIVEVTAEKGADGFYVLFKDHSVKIKITKILLDDDYEYTCRQITTVYGEEAGRLEAYSVRSIGDLRNVKNCD